MTILIMVFLFCVAILVVGIIVFLCNTYDPATEHASSPEVQAIASASQIAPRLSTIRTIRYRTRDGSGDYTFAFERRPGGDFRIFIVGYPSAEAERRAVHRLHEGRRPFICWQGSLATEAAARQVAATWADNMQTYLRTGRSF